MEKLMLNAHEDITNIVDREHMESIITKTMEQFIDKLVDICGPYARYALLISLDAGTTKYAGTGSNIDNRVFMRDGAHIVGNIEYLSPIQNYLKSAVLYLGTRIDSVCHDGTTTAMLFASILLRKYFTSKAKQTLRSYSTTQFEALCTKEFDEILTAFNKEKITKESLMEKHKCSINDAAAAIAYIQAYTSSNADKEVAEAVSYFFRYMPEESWNDCIVNQIPGLETTDYRVKAELSDYELDFDVNFLSTHLFNHERNRFYKMDDIDILIMRTGIHDSSIETFTLLDYLENIERPLFIFAPNGNYVGAEALYKINEIAQTKNKHIAIGCYNPTNNATPVLWSMDALTGKANKRTYDGVTDIEECIIRHAKIFIDGRRCYIDNVTPVDDRMTPNDNRHPGEVYPEDYSNYCDMKAFLSSYLDKAQRMHNKIYNEIHDIKKGLALLVTKRKVQIVLGGLSHDIQAMIPVIEDATGAALAAVKNGIYLNGIYRLYLVLKRMSEEQGYTEAERYFIESLKDTAKHCAASTFGPYSKVPERYDVYYTRPNFFETIEKLKDTHSYIDVSQKELKLNSLDNVIKDLINGDAEHLLKVYSYLKYYGYPPVQTADLYPELFKRLRELISRLAVTEMIVIPNTAWNKDLDKKKDPKKDA